MHNYTWKPINDQPKTFEEVCDFLAKSRGLSTHLIHTPYSLTDILRNPKELNISKEQILDFSKFLSSTLNSNLGVVIHGDYDVDGITSTAIFVELLLRIGFAEKNVHTFIPNRFNHGYGFSDTSLKEIANLYPVENNPLLILVDCGITSVSQIKKAKKLGYKVILIDHHQKKKNIPKPDILFWNSKLTASALSFFVSKYVEISIKGEADLKVSVDLAGLGYICDMGNLADPVGNALTKHSLYELTNNMRPGVKSLVGDIKDIKSYDVGWVIGPRLNASGRMADASKSLELLLGSSEDLGHIAEELNILNESRQQETKIMYEEAINGISTRKYPGIDQEQRVAIVHSKNFHEGVVGLVSSKISKNLNKPAICISWEGELGKASCRSITGVSILSLLESVNHLLESFGGHDAAAGFTIARKNYSLFESELLENAKKIVPLSLLEPFIFYDFSINGEFLNMDLLNYIDLLEPFGNGKPEPVFVLNNAQLSDFRLMGQEGNHLSFNVVSTNQRGVFFGGGNVLQGLTTNDRYDLLFNYKKNEWKGSVYPQLMIKDIKPSDF